MARKAQQARTRLVFFMGKGGVGKTTVSAAYALRTAAQHAKKPEKPVILISTDPAHSLADVLQVKLGPKPVKLGRIGTSAGQPGEAAPRDSRVASRTNLSRLARKSKAWPLDSALTRSARGDRGVCVWQIDPQREFAGFLDEFRQPMLELVERGTFFSKEEVGPFFDTALPGMAEIAALLALRDLLDSRKYSQIVVDTAPIGHTLRLFQLPGEFRKLLDFLDAAAGREAVLAAHFAHRALPEKLKASSPFVEHWRDALAGLLDLFRSADTELIFVTTPEPFALAQTDRTAAALEQELDRGIDRIVVNRLVTKGDNCLTCRLRVKHGKLAMSYLSREFQDSEILTGADTGAPVLGLEALRQFGRHIFDGKPYKLAPAPSRSAAAIALREAEWPIGPRQLAFTLGKGGVGKTTVSAGLAFARARSSQGQRTGTRVAICSTDPAPSLDDVFAQEVGAQLVSVAGRKNLFAAEIDSAAEYRAWAGRIRSTLRRNLGGEQRGVHIDLSFEQETLDALLEIVPPGVDEIVAILRILDLVETRELEVLIDMAPTGHALELLQMPERMTQWSRMLLKVLSAHRSLAVAQDIAVEAAAIGQRTRELVAAMKDRGRTAVYAVMLAEPLPDRETRRLLERLGGLQLTPTALFINRLLPERQARNCRRCGVARKWQLATLGQMAHHLRDTMLYVVPEIPGGVAGETGLERLTGQLWQVEPKKKQGKKPGSRKS